MRSRVSTIAVVAALAWIVYELVMAWLLREEFTVRDWMALAVKLSYLTGLLAAAAKGVEVLQGYASTVSPGLAAAVRATQGWLGYTWFTVVLPFLGLASSLYEYRRSSRAGMLLVLFNSLVLAYMALTLAGSVYQAPGTLSLGDVAVFVLAFPLSIIAAWRRLGPRWTLAHAIPLVSVCVSALYWPPL